MAAPMPLGAATWYCNTDLQPAWDVRAIGWHVLVDGDAPLDITN
jgi:hypothetical protein